MEVKLVKHIRSNSMIFVCIKQTERLNERISDYQTQLKLWNKIRHLGHLVVVVLWMDSGCCIIGRVVTLAADDLELKSSLGRFWGRCFCKQNWKKNAKIISHYYNNQIFSFFSFYVKLVKFSYFLKKNQNIYYLVENIKLFFTNL